MPRHHPRRWYQWPRWWEWRKRPWERYFWRRRWQAHQDHARDRDPGDPGPHL